MNVFLYSKILSLLILCTHITLIMFFIIQYIKIPLIQKAVNAIKDVLQKKGLLFALTISILATTGPLIYNYIYYFIPCTLCWYQRIFMFPLAIILLIANIRKDFKIKIYVYTLGILGLCVGTYHYITQRLSTHLGIDIGGCSAVGMSGNCSEYYLMEFGYITIPLMAMTGFILIIIFTYLSKNKQEQ